MLIIYVCGLFLAKIVVNVKTIKSSSLLHMQIKMLFSFHPFD